MTQVRYIAAGDCCELEASGHATGDEKVCAAVSALTQTLLGWLMNLEARGSAEILSWENKAGYFRVQATGNAANLACSFVFFGLDQLSKSFPKQVTVKK